LVWDASRPLLAESRDGVGPQDILLTSPSNRYGVLRALAILMPCLFEWTGCNVGALWMGRRMHLKKMEMEDQSTSRRYNDMSRCMCMGVLEHRG
jgi:hypothetical protein